MSESQVFPFIILSMSNSCTVLASLTSLSVTSQSFHCSCHITLVQLFEHVLTAFSLSPLAGARPAVLFCLASSFFIVQISVTYHELMVWEGFEHGNALSIVI